MRRIRKTNGDATRGSSISCHKIKHDTATAQQAATITKV
jgi:hypothetical protein